MQLQVEEKNNNNNDTIYEENNISRTTTIATANNKPSSYRLLFVDDNNDILIGIKSSLEDKGFIVDTFSNPLEALSSFKPRLYDLVLLGVRMEGMNGFELCKEMQKKIANRLDVKFCFITHFDPYREVPREEYPELNVECFIIPPISIEDLIKIINKELDT